jgi:nicotinamidase-related amidase
MAAKTALLVIDVQQGLFESKLPIFQVEAEVTLLPAKEIVF